MAIGWLSALKALPWGTILSNAPTVVDAANRLLSQTRRRSDAGDGPPGALESLQARIAALEEHDRADAAVLKQLAEEVAALARASEVIALRMRLVLLLSLIALVAAVAAIGLALG
ncbi:MAG TPA: hypothetical protein VFK15_14230 [Burkholderiales bacterium]|jgi:hypothetical protein|nr:hypothetical protein [Burkholderiales bacterium]